MLVGWQAGEMHTGNMIQNSNGEIVLFDFDDSSGDWPSRDVSYLSDATHLNNFSKPLYKKTLDQFKRFYAGYSEIRLLSDNEISSIVDFITIRHFQIVSRIIRCQGLHCLSEDTFNEQHDWLMRWRDQCAAGSI